MNEVNSLKDGMKKVEQDLQAFSKSPIKGDKFYEVMKVNKLSIMPTKYRILFLTEKKNSKQ